MRTVGEMRVAMTAGLVVATVAWIWVGGTQDLVAAMICACIIGAIIGWLGALATSRLPQTTPLAGLGLLAPSVLMFLLSVTAVQTLVLQPVVGGVLCLALVPSGWWLLQRSRSAVSSAHHDLVPSAGDTSFGVYTALTPLQTPSDLRPEAREDSSTLIDPDGGRDPATDWGDRRRFRDD